MKVELKGTILTGYERGMVYENRCEFTDNEDGTGSGVCQSVPVEQDVAIFKIDIAPILPQLKELLK